MEIKANNYYLDKDNCLIYVYGPLHSNGIRWQYICLTTNTKGTLGVFDMRNLLVKDFGSTIAPAIRLLYSGFNTHL